MADLGPSPPPIDRVESLEANRNGLISDAQRERIRSQMKRYARSRYLLISLTPALALAVALPIAVLQHVPGLLWLPVIFLGLTAPIVAWVRTRAGKVYADLAAGRVESVTGREAGRFVNSTTGEAYLRIGQVRMETFGAFLDRSWRLRELVGGQNEAHGERRAYYLPGSRLLIAAEPWSERQK